MWSFIASRRAKSFKWNASNPSYVRKGFSRIHPVSWRNFRIISSNSSFQARLVQLIGALVSSLVLCSIYNLSLKLGSPMKLWSKCTYPIICSTNLIYPTSSCKCFVDVQEWNTLSYCINVTWVWTNVPVIVVFFANVYSFVWCDVMGLNNKP